MKLAVWVLCFMSLGLIERLAAEPFDPGDDAYIVENIPENRSVGDAKQIRRLRLELAKNPLDAGAAVTLAKVYLSLARSEGDPRYSSYAEAALRPWQTRPNIPASILVVRALLRQHNHEFYAALIDLESALSRDTDNVQARITQTIVLQAQGRYREAREAAKHLSKWPAQGLICAASVESFSGRADLSDQRLSAAYEASIYRTPEEKFWVLSVLADIAVRRGDVKAAEMRFREAASLGIQDVNFLAMRSDFLLDRDRPNEVVDLLKDKSKIDLLLLRLAIAETRLGMDQSVEHAAMLRARLVANELRGVESSSREDARLLHIFGDDSAKALEVARANWAIQKEPEDALILLETAIAAKSRNDIETVRQWVKNSGLEDVRLDRLLRINVATWETRS